MINCVVCGPEYCWAGEANLVDILCIPWSSCDAFRKRMLSYWQGLAPSYVRAEIVYDVGKTTQIS